MFVTFELAKFPGKSVSVNPKLVSAVTDSVDGTPDVANIWISSTFFEVKGERQPVQEKLEGRPQ